MRPNAYSALTEKKKLRRIIKLPYLELIIVSELLTIGQEKYLLSILL